VLADEINRATPKTQSALLEAMQEQSVTIAARPTPRPALLRARHAEPPGDGGHLPPPRGPARPLLLQAPGAFPKREELHSILDRTTGAAEADVKPVLDRARILELRALVPRGARRPLVQDYAIRLVLATHPDEEGATAAVKRYVRFGASPRGAQSVLLAAKIRAVMDGRFSARAPTTCARRCPRCATG
jgi:MoxR-like ATPase